MKINSNKLKSLFLLGLVGSNLAKEEKTDNQSELTLNSLPQIGANFTKRGNETDPTLVFAGYPISISREGGYDPCSFGFAIVWPDENTSKGCSWGELTGFITSSSCCPRNEDCSSMPVYLNSTETVLGYVWTNGYVYSSFTDFAFVTHVKPKGVEDNIKFIPYVVGEKDDLIPITSYGPASVGERACVYAATLGRMCGKVVELGKIIMEVRSNGLGLDYGGLVYKENSIGDRTIAQLVGHINDEDFESLNYTVYYTPVEQTLEVLATKENCHYVPLVYNETNAQQYDNLLAQIEIPPKK